MRPLSVKTKRQRREHVHFIEGIQQLLTHILYFVARKYPKMIKHETILNRKYNDLMYIKLINLLQNIQNSRNVL